MNIGVEEQFVKHPKSDNETNIWHHFLTNKEKNKGKCLKCMSIIKAEGKSTGGLHNHMINVHKVNTRKKHIDLKISPFENNDSKSSTENVKISAIFQRTESLDEVISRMASLDGIPFRVFCVSEDIRKGLIARGYKDIPRSPNSIRKCVLRYAEKIRKETIAQLSKLKSDGNKFSTSSDEWTSVRNKRYINVNIHSNKDTWNLGIGRAFGKLPAEKIVQLVQTRLERFDLNASDIVSLTTDGAKVMEKVGRLFDAEHQLCIVHGLHLAVLDVLYKKKPAANSIHSEDTTVDIQEEILDEEEESQSFVVENSADNTEANDLTDDYNIFDLIKKVRDMGKLFRRSPTKNDEILQRYVIDEFKQPLSLILDCKTRWSSLLDMIQRFYQLRNCVRKSLIDLKSKISFSDDEMEMIGTVIEILSPIKLAVEALCREDANLLTANATLEFLLGNIGSGTDLHDKMRTALENRISERLTDLSNLTQYLHNGTFVHSSLGLRRLSKDNLLKTIMRLADHPETEVEDVETEQIEMDVSKPEEDSTVTCGPLTLKQRLQEAIASSSAGFGKQHINKRDFTKVIKREIAVLEDGGGRGIHLEAVYSYLLTIKPTSVDSERAFSNSSSICTKVRARLSDESIDALAFLRSYFQKIKAKDRKRFNIVKLK